MKRILFVALFAVACATTPDAKPPEGRIVTQAHPEFEKWRPVAIAVMPVEAPAHQLRTEVRKEVYNNLFARKYSPFMLQAVDRRLTSDGTFDGDDLSWDATFNIHITEWKPVAGTDRFAVTATATMTHRNGEVLWECQVDRKSFKVDRNDYSDAAKDLAILLTSATNLPERPPLPVE